MARDTQRLRVYRAEWDFREYTTGRAFETISEVRRYVSTMQARKRVPQELEPYFQAYRQSLREYRGIKVEEKGRTRAMGSRGLISLPNKPWFMNEITVLHEFAHALVERRWPQNTIAWHGPEFCRVLLTLVEWRMGKDEADLFALCMTEQGVRRAGR
jgi:putative metallohydrolase (TIGR04338 family)